MSDYLLNAISQEVKKEIDEKFIAYLKNDGKPVYDFSDTKLLMKSLQYADCPMCSSNNVNMISYMQNEGHGCNIKYFEVMCNDCETSSKAESVYSYSEEEAISKAHQNWHRRKGNII